MWRPEILSKVEALGYEVFEKGAYNLNIIGVRSQSREANQFDDRLHLAYRNDTGFWVEHVWPITTDPGTYWLQNPERIEGTAILVPNQYKGAYKIGLHRGQYEALVQSKEVEVYRDNDRDNQLDPTTGPHKGMFGINIHRSNGKYTSTSVDKWSAGCQVFSDPDDFGQFMRLAKRAASVWGPSFTYTLIGE